MFLAARMKNGGITRSHLCTTHRASAFEPTLLSDIRHSLSHYYFLTWLSGVTRSTR